MKFIFFSACLFIAITFSAYSQVKPYTVPEEFSARYYLVTANNVPVPIFHAGLNVYFAAFDFAGDVEIKIYANYKSSGQYNFAEPATQRVISDSSGFWGKTVLVKPLSKKISPKLNNLEVSFRLTEAGQYSVETEGIGKYNDDVLLIFANRPEANVKDISNPNLVYLSAGIHQRNIDLKSGQTLYLEAGAVLFGSINVWDAKNVSILGKGTVVYYGPHSDVYDFGWKNQKNWHVLTTHNVEGLTVKGITFITRNRTWAIQTHTTFDAVFENIKTIAVNSQNVNTDAISWYGGGRTTIRNCFFRTQDDCFAFFTPESSKDLYAKDPKADTNGEVKDVRIENCVLSTTLANIFRIGFRGQSLLTANISIKDCDVIHFKNSTWFAPSALINSEVLNRPGLAVHSNWRIEDVRFEVPAALFGLQDEKAQWKNIFLKNISMIGDPVASMIKGKFKNVIIENVMLNGKYLRKEADIPLLPGSSGIMKAKFVIN